MVDSRRARRRQEWDRERGVRVVGGGGAVGVFRVAAAGSESSFPSLSCGCAPPMSLKRSLQPSTVTLEQQNLLLPPNSPPKPSSRPPPTRPPPKTRQSIGSLLLQVSLSSENHPAFPIFFCTFFLFARPPTLRVVSGLSAPCCNMKEKKKPKQTKEATV